MQKWPVVSSVKNYQILQQFETVHVIASIYKLVSCDLELILKHRSQKGPSSLCDDTHRLRLIFDIKHLS